MNRRLSATHLIDSLVDPDSYVSWDEELDPGSFPDSYRTVLERAAQRAGTDESVLTGRGLVRDRPVAVIASEFRFLAGSIGADAASRIVAAVRRATAERLPIIASPSSGGTRMQEGTPAFVRMIDISRALMDHKAAGLPYIVFLRDPTTGGALASWASLGHITVAEPGALVGFLGPKVYQLMTGAAFPVGVQTAENLAVAGVLDAVVPIADLAVFVDRVLGTLIDPASPASVSPRPGAVSTTGSAWSSIERTQREDRAGVREVLRHGGSSTVCLSGTAAGERDDAVVVALTRFDGRPCVVVGQDRHAQATSPMGPAGLRQARRGMALAAELGLPLVTFVDTAGAELSVEAEEGAVAGEIARCIGTMSSLPVPAVSVLLGQGCGGGALALLSGARVVAAEHAWLSPLPPAGASAIVYGDVAHAPELAESHRIRATDLLELGFVHHVIPEYDADTAESFARAVAAEVATQLRAFAG